MLLETVMAREAGQAFAKAMYMRGLGNDEWKPWPSSHAWTDGGSHGHNDARSFMPDGSYARNLPHESGLRSSRKEATHWLRPRDVTSASSSRTALFPDGRAAVQAQQQQPQQQQPQQQQQPNPVDATEPDDFVFETRRNAQGSLELFCETCGAWCGDDPQYSGHLASAKHRSWKDHFEKQKKLRSSLPGSTPASVGTPSYGCCGPPQRSFVFGPGTIDAEVPDFVTHEDLQRRVEQIRSCGHEAENITDEGMTKMYVRQEQQQHLIEKQSAQIAELRLQWLEMRATVGELQDFLRRELA
jgi:hypothetical protein